LKESSKLSNSSLHHSPQIISQQNSILNKTNHQNSNSTDLNVHLNDSIIKECNTLIENFNNPYLKALFNYILNGDDSIEKILVCIIFRAKKNYPFLGIIKLFYFSVIELFHFRIELL
jgi:hypothetical protein